MLNVNVNITDCPCPPHQEKLVPAAGGGVFVARQLSWLAAGCLGTWPFYIQSDSPAPFAAGIVRALWSALQAPLGLSQGNCTRVKRQKLLSSLQAA